MMSFSLRTKLFFYELGVRIYTGLERIAALFGHQKAKKRAAGLSQWTSNLQHWRSYHPGNLWWIHAASLGEYEMAVPLLKALRKREPESSILLSFYSPSGFEQRKDSELVDGVFYLPTDLKKNARNWVQILNPNGVIFIKYEIWLNYLFELHRADTPSFLVNAVFRQSQRFFHKNSLFMEGLKVFDHIFVQYDSSEKLLRNHGLDKVSTTGDLRFERVAEIAERNEEVPCIAQFKGEAFLLVGGSTWPEEEQLLAEVLKELKEWKLALFPHEFGHKRKKQLRKTFAEFKPVFWSENPEYRDAGRVYIIDTIGMLSKSYRYATAAVVGGGFSGKLHNILEPLAFGVPVFTGPKTQRFEEAQVFEEKNELVKVRYAQQIVKNLTSKTFDKNSHTALDHSNITHILKIISAS